MSEHSSHPTSPSSSISISAAFDQPTTHFRRRSSLSTSTLVSISKAEDRMSKNRYPPHQLLPTSDPYEDAEHGEPSLHSFRGSSTTQKQAQDMGAVQRALRVGGWRRNVALCAVGMLGLYVLFGGASTGVTRESGVGGQGTNLDSEGKPMAPGVGDHDFSDTLNLKPPSNAQASKPKTGECVVPKGKPPHRYALMMDAGSTGSRIHVYKFSYCAPMVEGDSSSSSSDFASADVLPTLDSELFYHVEPGLSSYSGRPKDAAESLRELMEKAVAGVPADQRSCTPIAVKATAGLRLLGDKESGEILREVEGWLRKDWPFVVVDKGVSIMDGSDEGVYAWVTINYLLNLIGPTTADNATAAVMDLGGASTQIVFEPTFLPSSSQHLEPGDHVYELTFAAQKHPLYQHSHLGYGLMQGRRSVHNFVAFSWLWLNAPKGNKIEWEDLTPSIEIPNPCLVKGSKKVVKLDPPGRKIVEVTFVGTGAGFEACRRVVDVVMAKDAVCVVEPCAFGGVYQPRLMDTFDKGPIYALSYFYDRIAPLGLESPFKIADLRKLTNDVCAGPGSPTWSRFTSSKEAMAELDDRPEHCLDLSFMYGLLAFGYELADQREIIISKKIDGVELGWALGAAIALLDGKIECKA